jgi:cytochrome b6-f complex iron-sulfur subunit
MAGGLAASYGTFGTIAARYLYPSGKAKTNWQFVVAAGEVKKGAALLYRVPGGEQVTIARREETGAVEDFVALSSTCPHLGCKVHWQSTEQRFFCPCHNGAFDASGKATAGPPADAGQSLPRYPLKVEDGLLFIEVPSDPLQVG